MTWGEPPEFDSFEEIEAVFKALDDLEKAFSARLFSEAHQEIESKGAKLQPTCLYEQGTRIMKMSEAFPSKYLKAEDVEDEPVLTIVEMQVENVAAKGEKEEKKCVLYFKEEDKGMVVNKTNWKTIAEVLGSDDSDDWYGKKIQLYIGDATFKGETVDAIRVKRRGKRPERSVAPVAAAALPERSEGREKITPAQARAARSAQTAYDENYDGSERDEIPF